MKFFLLLATAAIMCFPAFAADQPQPPSQPDITINVPSLTHPPTETATTPDPSGTAVDVEPVKQAAGGPLQIKVNDNINFKFGVLLQPQADFTEDASGHTAQNLMLRRTRFIVAGQVAKNVFFFYQTENSRLGGAVGGAAKVISTGFQTIDAVAEWRITKAFNIWGGLVYLPTSREALKSSASEFMIDVNSYAYTATTALQGTGGRDTGVMARGYFMGDHLEYRAGLFSGLRSTGVAKNPFRMIGRLQYNFFDTEVYNLPSYAGNNFGTKKILALGVADDKQSNYNGPVADLFADIPTGFGSSVTTLTWMHLSGGTFVPALGKSKIYVADTGFYLRETRLGPWVRYERRTFAAPKASSSERRYLVGINWYPFLSNFNVKTAVGELKPTVGRNQKQVTLQLQFFYF